MLRDFIPNRQEEETEPPRTTNRNSHTTMIAEIVRDIMLEYNNNIHEYQENTRRFLQLLTSIHEMNHNNNNNNPNNTTRQRTPNVRTTNDTWTNNGSFLFRTIRSFLRPMTNVIVRPTEQQITDFTRSVVYTPGTNFVNTNCPITLEDFQEGDVVTQIIHCRHCFRPRSIQNWFQSNVRCPVCRFDIRDTVLANTNDDQSEIVVNDDDLSGNANMSSIRSEISTILQRYLTTDPEGFPPEGTIYTFNIPIDISYQYVDSIYR